MQGLRIIDLYAKKGIDTSKIYIKVCIREQVSPLQTVSYLFILVKTMTHALFVPVRLLQHGRAFAPARPCRNRGLTAT